MKGYVMAGKARAVAAVPAEETEDQKRKRLLRKAYGQASQDLRDKFRSEFETFYSTRAGEAGIEWSPRLTPEQKAEQEFEALVEQYPYLLDRVDALRDRGEQQEDDPGNTATV
jgi:hypothetical protein